MTNTVVELVPGGLEWTGFLFTEIFDADDPRPAREQANERYAHGGGWHPSPNWTMDTRTGVARYPGDPVFKPVARAQVNDETIWVYQYGLVAIVQPDGSFEVSRMD